MWPRSPLAGGEWSKPHLLVAGCDATFLICDRWSSPAAVCCFQSITHVCYFLIARTNCAGGSVVREILIHFGLQTLMPAALLAGLAYTLMKWADEYSTAAKKWARDWLSNPRSFHTDAIPALTEMHRLLYGTLFSLRRLAFVGLSIVIVGAFIVTFEPTPQSTNPQTVRESIFWAILSLFPSAATNPLSFLVIYSGILLTSWCSIWVSDVALSAWAKRLGRLTFPICHFSGGVFIFVSSLFIDHFLATKLPRIVTTSFMAAAPIATIPLMILIFLTTSFAALVAVLMISTDIVVEATKYLLPFMGKKEMCKRPLTFLAPAASAATFLSASALLLLSKLSPY